VNRLPNVTHPMSIGSAAKRADRRRDPTPINNFGNFRTYGCIRGENYIREERLSVVRRQRSQLPTSACGDKGCTGP
jgi:hypothetical protein